MVLILLILKRDQVYKLPFLFSTAKLKWGHRFYQFKLTFKSEILNVCFKRPQRGGRRVHEILGNVAVNYGWLLQSSNFCRSIFIHMYRK